MLTKNWSRKRWIAEFFGCDLASIETYQSTQRAKENRLPIFQAGCLLVCVLPTDSRAIVESTLDGRVWVQHNHWADESVIVFKEQQ